jgi:hypothetical protein
MPATHANQLLATTRPVSPVVDFWNNGNPSRTLVIHTHGMQDPPNQRLVGLDLAARLPLKNYAFTTPFNTALNNAGFINQPATLIAYESAFRANAARFAAPTPPALKVYPYLFPIAGLGAVLDTLHQAGTCDVMCLVDLQPYPNQQYITLDALLSANHPLGGGQLYNAYDSFLLLACRSSTAQHQIGMGGAPATYPNGLYRGEERPAEFRYPFRVVRESPI